MHLAVFKSICSSDNWKSLARPVRASISVVYRDALQSINCKESWRMLKRVIFFFFWLYLDRLFRGNELKEPVPSRFLVFRVISPLVACSLEINFFLSTFFFFSNS